MSTNTMAPHAVGTRDEWLAAREQLLVHPLQALVAVRSIHQQADQLRIGQERAAVGMVGGEHDAPRIRG